MEQDKNNFLIDPETGEKFDIVGKGPVINNTDQLVLAVVEVQPGQIVKRHSPTFGILTWFSLKKRLLEP